MTLYTSTDIDEFAKLCREIRTLTSVVVGAGQRSVLLRERGRTLPQTQIETVCDQISQLESKLNELAGWFPQFANGV